MYKLSAAGGHRPPAVCCFSRPTVGEGLAPPALRTLPCQRKIKPPSDEGGFEPTGLDGGAGDAERRGLVCQDSNLLRERGRASDVPIPQSAVPADSSLYAREPGPL